MFAARAVADRMKDGLSDGGLLWLAYPKGTSKKYRNVDIIRDTGCAAMKELGFDGVSLIAIYEHWLAILDKRTG